MAFNHSDRTITDFRSKLTGGGARSNLFEISIPDFPTDNNITEREVEFMAKAAAIPAANIGSIPVPFRGRVLPIAGDRTFNPWTVTIINDTNFHIRDAMERWSDFINDVQTAQGAVDPESYQKTGFIKQLSRKGSSPNDSVEVLREYKFTGIFPTEVSEIPLDYGATDQIQEFTVTFQYLFWEVIGGTTDYGTSLREGS